jgi:hypothetical protein
MFVDQQQALAELAHHTESIHSLVTSAVAIYNGTLAEQLLAHTKRTKASSIHDYFFDAAKKFCEGRTDARVHTQNLMRLLVLDERYVFRFKMLDEDDLPRNQPTVQVRKFRSQMEIEGLGEYYRLEIGYKLAQIGTLERVLLVCPSSTKANAWASNIVGSEQLPVVVPLFPTAPEPAEPTVRGKHDIQKPESGDADPGA